MIILSIPAIRQRKPFLFCLVVLFLVVPIWADDAPLRGLAGPPFTDPSQIQEMPEEWKKQPVQHDPSVGDVDIAITLDQHLYPALLTMIQKYAGEHDLKISFNEGTCGISSGMLASKSVDIAGFCCSPGATDRLPGLQFHTIGIDALALLVHPGNPIENVTLNEARQIFTGEIYSWSELKTTIGGRGMNMPIQPVGRLHCKIRPGNWRLLLDNEALFSPGLLEVGAIADMISVIASNPRAIGYEVMWNLIRYKKKGRVKALRIDGYSPEEGENLISGKYPLYRVYNLTTWEGKGVTNPHAQKLVEYLLQHVENIDETHGIIPASRLRKAGWKFEDDELIGEPIDN
jgi:ABC-type phosphate transport system substrate-binding protein